MPKPLYLVVNCRKRSQLKLAVWALMSAVDADHHRSRLKQGRLKQNLHDISMGAVIASGFFGVGLMIIVFTNTELFTSNNMYLTISS